MEGFIIKDLLINEQIRYSGQVRLVGEDGEQLGIVSMNEARQMATEKELDLALISPNANPMVCKLMNYGKFKYEQQKKKNLQRANKKLLKSKQLDLVSI